MNDADSRLLERLLIIAEEDSENFFKYTRHGAEWRREVMEKLDTIEANQRRSKKPSDAEPADLKTLILKFAPWVIAAVEGIAHVVRSLHL